MNDLETIKDSIKITDLARELGIELRGKQGRCFNHAQHKHQDKHFSLGFDTAKNRFKCFACGVSGSVIDLYKAVKGGSVAEAITALKGRAGISEGLIKQAKTSKPATVTPPKPTEAEKTQYSHTYQALKGCCGTLDTDSLAYLKGRGLTEATIERFKIFTVKDNHKAKDALLAQFSLADLEGAGIISEHGNLLFYYHKIIIPFYEGGHIVFLQGRRLDNRSPKYLHIKRPVPLFNTDTLKGMKRGERVYICEGVFDALILEQNGFKAVAILGVNNFKPEWTDLFKGLDVVLCLDNDDSGKAGTQTLAKIFFKSGQTVKTKTLPDGVKDITDYFLQEGK